MAAHRRYRVSVLRSAERFLDWVERSQPADLARIENAIEELADNPRPNGCTPLAGYRNVWRHRVGNYYRICYRIDDGELVVLVITISTRDDVYEQLRRHLGR